VPSSSNFISSLYLNKKFEPSVPSDEVGDKDGSLPTKNPQGKKQKLLEWVQSAYQQKERSFDK
jgi:hypothetical protein